MAEFMRRFATGLDTYEFAEVRSDDFDDFVVAAEMLANHVADRYKGAGDSEAAAVTAAKKTFGNTTPVQSGGFGDKGRQAQQSEPEELELGERDGYKIVARKSKFGGVYFNAYNSSTKQRINSKSVPGMTVSQATLDVAIEKISEAA